jgi:hypothetical protein
MIAPQDIESPSFAGHESFTLRYAWLPKCVRTVIKHRDLFVRDDALVHLGVGKNMVRSIRHWSLMGGFVKEEECRAGGRRAAPTPLGLLLFGPEGLDPYLEDPATLWLIHWRLASRPEGPTTWYWAFNEYPDAEFTREKLRAALGQFIDRAGWKRIADSSLNRDVDCFIRTYVASEGKRSEVLEETLDCPLTELGLIQNVDGMNVYAFSRGEHPSLPLGVFVYALLDFWNKAAVGKKTVSFDQATYHAGSPGRVFKLSDDAIGDYLDALEDFTKGAILYGTTAGLRQLYMKRTIDPGATVGFLRRHFENGKD